MIKLKKSLSVLLSFALIFAIVPLSAITASAAISGYYTYTVSNDKAIITAVSTSISGYVAIPSTLDGYPVTGIGSSAFRSCSNLTSITIPDSVTGIGEKAFYGCSGLTNISIPNGVRSIGRLAFGRCSSLKSITIPNSVTSISQGAFDNCSSLTSITIPFIGSSRTANETYDAVFGYIFGYTSSDSAGSIVQKYNENPNSSIRYIIPSTLKNVTITDATQIPYGAFYGCSSLTSITILDSVSSIGEKAFYGCSSLTGIIIPDGVTSIESSAFYGCSSLKNITIPNSVTSIGYGAFNDCNNLTIICVKDSTAHNYAELFNISYVLTSGTDNGLEWLLDIETGVLTISGNGTIPNCFSGDSPWYDLKNYIRSVIIDDGIRSISTYAFCYCINLTNITIGENNIYYSSVNGVLFNKNKTELIQYPIGSSRISYSIPNGVISIGTNAFYNCSNLTSITIPNGVTSIGEQAFENCSSLTSITIPNGVTSIGRCAFFHCSSLTSITIPNSVTSISNAAFYGCCSLKSIIIPNSVIKIGSGAFDDCSSLTDILVDSENSMYSSLDGVLFDKDKTELLIYPKGKKGDYVVPNSITSIGSYVFKSCTGLTSIIIPEGVTSISDCSFYNCTGLTSVTIPDSVTNIENSAFLDDDSIKTVRFYSKKQLDKYKSLFPNSEFICLCENSEHVFTDDNDTICDKCLCFKTPNAPIIKYKYSGTVELIATDGFEYSKDGIYWQKNNVFKDLSANTTYTFYQRVTATEENHESEKSEPLTIYLKSFQSVSSPVVQSFTDTTITLTPFEGCEYRLDEEGEWQKSNTFTNLSPATSYTAYQRMPENDMYEASYIRNITVRTDKSIQTSIPEAPTVINISDRSISLNMVNGCEYSKDGINWQSSSYFSNLQPVTEYTFYQRYAATSTMYAGASSKPLKVKTDKVQSSAPSAPTLSFKTHNKVVLQLNEKYEYSCDGINWQKSNIFTGLSPSTNYLFYQRIAENDYYYTSAASKSLTVRTNDQPQYITGDLNGDENINSLDGLMLLRYLNGWNVEIVSPEAMDINGDEKINSLDGLMLLRYLNGWDIELG